ncbi:methyltransferase domain-containing protein [Luteimonas sp. MC1895]|uniref:methyltransferase domain-containing protein n=1 Tax=Luteimonas sp. MC1895 TaxID=2819513 RepID=UPI0018F0AEB9|nr:methyltransferase domain-containing protein [Luteimonas sp. MC1895]MBJ6980045.1 methyltransferase domain-containing protein [Luteimonas sp. MC1895]
MTPPRTPFAAALVFWLALGGCALVPSGIAAASDRYTPEYGQLGKDVVWIPTPQPVVERMLDLAGVGPDDRLVDLGSGDGVTVIAAARRGATARGIEFNPDLVALSRRRAKAAGVAARASFERGDIFESDFSDATVITLFLLPELNLRLRPVLLDMPPGTRIVSNSFDMGDWTPDATAEVGEGCEHYCEALLWIVPANVAGLWTIDGRRSMELAQSHQKIGGIVREGEAHWILRDAGMDGARIRFSLGEDRYEGEVRDGVMKGTVNGVRPWRATRHAAP